MIARNLNCLLLAAVMASTPLAWSANSGSPRLHAFATQPDWTGLWETDAAAQLLRSGKWSSTALQDRPPYNAEWEEKIPPVAPPLASQDPLPSTAKICAPAGFPAAMGQPVPDTPFEFLVTPEQTLFVASDRTIRHIYTDGRAHPGGAELWPTTEGHSIGRWQGQTLVVDTIARTAGPVTAIPGSAIVGEKAHFTEKLRLLDHDTLQNEMTIEDPERLARPWRIVIRYQRVRDMDRMIPVDCLENDRNPVVEGKIVIAPP